MGVSGDSWTERRWVWRLVGMVVGELYGDTGGGAGRSGWVADGENNVM